MSSVALQPCHSLFWFQALFVPGSGTGASTGTGTGSVFLLVLYHCHFTLSICENSDIFYAFSCTFYNLFRICFLGLFLHMPVRYTVSIIVMLSFILFRTLFYMGHALLLRGTLGAAHII